MNFEFGESSAHTEARTRQQALKFATQILNNLRNFTGIIVRITPCLIKINYLL